MMSDAAFDAPIRPFTAMRAVKRLLRDLEDTRQVFVVWLPGQDWEALLARPLAEVRRALNILPPARYQEIRP